MTKKGFHQLPDSAEMYYEFYTNENAEKTLILLNGLSQSTLAWVGFVQVLSKKYQILLLDLIFQGQSFKAEKYRSFDEHAQDVVNLMDFLQIEKAIISGISYGGAVTLRLLVNHQERFEKGIVLASFAHKTEIFNAHGLAWTNALKAGGYELMLDVMLPSVLGAGYFEKPLIPIEVLKTARKDIQPSAEQLFKLMQATAESGDYRPELQKVEIPVLVVVGEEDVLCTPAMNQSIAESFKNGTFKTIPKAGHTLNLEAIPQTIEQIISFVDNYL